MKEGVAMKCPWREKEMTEGFIISTRQVLFSKQQNDDFFFIKGKDDINLTQFNWTHPAAKAYHCENCKKVVVDYAKEIQRKLW